MDGFVRGAQESLPGCATGSLSVGTLLLDILELLLKLGKSGRQDSSHGLSWALAELLLCTSAAGTVPSLLSSVSTGRFAGLCVSTVFVWLLAISSFTVAKKEGESFFLEHFGNLDSFLTSFSSLPSSAGVFPFSTGEGVELLLPSTCCVPHRLSFDKVFINRLAVLLRFKGGGLDASLLEDTEFILPIFCKGVPETWEYKEEKALATVVSTSIWRKRPAQEWNTWQSLQGYLLSSHPRSVDPTPHDGLNSQRQLFFHMWSGNFHHHFYSPTHTHSSHKHPPTCIRGPKAWLNTS